FCLVRHTPTSTLFPYTTLFRSAVLVEAEHVQHPREEARADHAELLAHGVPDHDRGGAFHGGLRGRGREGHHLEIAVPDHQGPDRDRKSTRLNSSHVSISYAVFC